jgi:regulator of sigma E protease
MIGMNLFYMLLAILGLGFLIFIHELGHYWMARRVGMRVETFAIGFGKPIYSWMKDGVKWQIGWLPFGGYVKIAGTDESSKEDPYQVADGFYGKGPWNRIKVAFMGPAVNLLFAFLLFAFIWMAGGREKSFSETTAKIGWVDPHSELFAKGMRPGDEIISYNGKPYVGFKDHIYASLLGGNEIIVRGNHVDYEKLEKVPFEYSLAASGGGSDRKPGALASPANYLIYMPSDVRHYKNPPIESSGIEPKDRVIWVDGELIFSTAQLVNVLNDGRALLTIKRGSETLQVRCPRVEAEELKFTAESKEELIDWQYEADLKADRWSNLYVIPYNLNNEAVVEGNLHFIDREKEQEVFERQPFSAMEAPLLAGDRIIAIDGQPITRSYELLRLLQTRSVHIIVERDSSIGDKISSADADIDFDKHLNMQDVAFLAASIGTGKELEKAGNYVLLKSITPLKEKDIARQSPSTLVAEAEAREKVLQSIEDKEKRAQVERHLEKQQNRLAIGLVAGDRKVEFNPSPWRMFSEVVEEIGYTLQGLFSGSLSPKWLSGPVGIVQVVQNTWAVGIKEALFWIGAISLNLGVLNLLPIPVLDGGTIVLSFVELVTGRRVPPKTLEKIVIPFALLLIGFMIFATYHDLLRIFGGFLK